MLKKVFMLPTPSIAALNQTNSINQICLRLQKYLPTYGYEITEDRSKADLIAGHAGQNGGQYADVAHCHGLYPTAIPNSSAFWWEANRLVIDALRTAKAVTVPSEWVADMLRRDMGIRPHVIGWGVDCEEWQPDENKGWVLWNKTRPDPVCDPTPFVQLAALVPQQRFLSTFGDNPTPNLRVIGDAVKFEHMKQIVRNSSVYVSTTIETFGIGTLEAMACKIPVLGWRWGGTEQLVKHGINGYLCEPGDVKGMVAGLEYCLAHRQTLGANGRKLALEYTWDKVARNFAAVYDRVLEPQPQTKVSVIVPCYNYGRWLPEAVSSVQQQETNFGYEIIIVNDCSADNTAEVAQQLIADNPRADVPVKVLNLEKNGGVAQARNTGIQAAVGQYIVCLDADDKLGNPRFLQALADALDKNPALGITFTGLTPMNEAGQLAPAPANWPMGFDYERQLAGHNQVPTCCMFRKEAWQRAGGYRTALQPAEDAALWLRITTLGFDAQQTVKEGWFHYRFHGNSLSSVVRTGKKREPNWHDFTWIRTGQRPFAALGKPPRHSWAVRNFRPLVTVIVPVGPGHESLLYRALDSIENQTEKRWACIVVNDTGKELLLPAWAVEIKSDKHNAGGARNLGIQAATTPLITFLDADDQFLPTFLERTLKKHYETGRYIYTDWLDFTKEGLLEPHETFDYELEKLWKRGSLHSINVVMKRADALAAGGFDETMVTWEDVDFFMRLATMGVCGFRLNEALVIYDYQTGTVRERGEAIKEDMKRLIKTRFEPYMRGEKVCQCNELPSQAKPEDIQLNSADYQRCVYNGGMAGHDVVGLVTNRYYGYRQRGDIFLVHKNDIAAAPETYTPIVEVKAPAPATVLPPAPVLI